MAIVGYASGRTRLNWLGLDSVAAALPLAHFALSVGVWLIFFGAALYDPLDRPHFFREFGSQITFFGPAFVFLCVSATAYVLALHRRRRLSLRLTVAVVIAAGLCFWMDVARGRWQVSVDIATQAYWDAGNPAHQYFTWWWYNDRWFAHRALDRTR